LGISCSGYDPAFQPANPLQPSDVVNLGYVLNVIEEPHERQYTLKRAWSLARGLLVVSARMVGEARDLTGTTCRDGVLTSTGTFQKFYEQEELRNWIEHTLGVATVAAAPGVFYVFRHTAAEQAFLLNRVRTTVSRPHVSKELFERHHEILCGLMAFLEQRGRLPRSGEWGGEAQVRDSLGSLRQAFLIIRRLTGQERWDRVRVQRSEDLLVFLALARFGRRPRLNQLPQELRYDIRDLFGSHKAACQQADRLLFAVADQARVLAAVRAATVGKRTPNALYVHVSSLSSLAPILRVREGCARALLGTVQEAALIKLHTDRPHVSYLEYPRFDQEAHPALRSGYIVRLNDLSADYRDYSGHSNPPILHRKELFVNDGYPLKQRFARLTRQEVRACLYAQPQRIGTSKGWADVLREHGVSIVGHRLVKQPR
jgi:DNA phosphorothioation-associated putative methyltransferase